MPSLHGTQSGAVCTPSAADSMMKHARPSTVSRGSTTWPRPCPSLRPGTRSAAASPVVSESATATAERTTVALKEWHVANQALHKGLQTILVRKGGIREPVFKPPGQEFLLFPTSFHSEANLLKPAVRDAAWCKEAMKLEPKTATRLDLDTYVEVTGAWVTEDPSVLSALDDLHIWTQEFVEARLKWRSQQPLTLLEVRAWKLQPTLDLKVEQDFFGCFSFVDLSPGLSQPVSLDGAVPALSDEEFQQRQALLRDRLAHVTHTPLEL